MITRQDVLIAQEEWGTGIVKIGSAMPERRTCEQETERLIDSLYAFERGRVLFKPTKAADIQFRFTKAGATSYFIAGNEDYPEDHGFALNPWLRVRFENASMILEETRAFAMGNYYFTNPNGNEIRVEYTFGYTQAENGNLKIDLHHSSLPYTT